MKKFIFVQALVFAWCLLQLVPGIATSGEAAHGNDEFSKCQNEQPGNTDVLIDLAIRYQEDSQYRKSNACARKALRQEPNNAIVNYIVGFTNLICGILDDNNEAYFRKAIATDTSGIVSQKASEWLSLYSKPLTVTIEKPRINKKIGLQSDWVKRTDGKVTHSRKKEFQEMIDAAVYSTVVSEIDSILRDHKIFSVSSKSSRGSYCIHPEISVDVKENSGLGVNIINKTPLGLLRIIPGVTGAVDDQAAFDIDMNVLITMRGPKLSNNIVFENSEKLTKINVQDVSSKMSEVYTQKIKDLEFTLRKALLTGDTSKVPDEQIVIDTSGVSKSGAELQDDAVADKQKPTGTFGVSIGRTDNIPAKRNPIPEHNTAEVSFRDQLIGKWGTPGSYIEFFRDGTFIVRQDKEVIKMRYKIVRDNSITFPLPRSGFMANCDCTIVGDEITFLKSTNCPWNGRTSRLRN